MKLRLILFNIIVLLPSLVFGQLKSFDCKRIKTGSFYFYPPAQQKGYLIITLRLTNIQKIKKSFQYINFSKKMRGEKATYQIVNMNILLKKLSKLNISKILHYGYWGRPNKTVVTDHKKIFFVAMALKKNKTKKNIVNLEKLRKIIN